MDHPGYTKMGCAKPVFGFLVLAAIAVLGVIAFTGGWLG